MRNLSNKKQKGPILHTKKGIKQRLLERPNTVLFVFSMRNIFGTAQIRHAAYSLIPRLPCLNLVSVQMVMGFQQDLPGLIPL